MCFDFTNDIKSLSGVLVSRTFAMRHRPLYPHIGGTVLPTYIFLALAYARNGKRAFLASSPPSQLAMANKVKALLSDLSVEDDDSDQDIPDYITIPKLWLVSLVGDKGGYGTGGSDIEDALRAAGLLWMLGDEKKQKRPSPFADSSSSSSSSSGSDSSDDERATT